MNVIINNSTEYDLINYTEDMKKAVFETLRAEKITAKPEISVSFVTEYEISILNKKYRHIEQSTDVLSFPMLEINNCDYRGITDGTMLGDIVICFDKAYVQAKEYGNTCRREIIFLIIHGTLHLLGYDHMNLEDEAKMIMKQKEIIKAFD